MQYAKTVCLYVFLVILFFIIGLYWLSISFPHKDLVLKNKEDVVLLHLKKNYLNIIEKNYKIRFVEPVTYYHLPNEAGETDLFSVVVRMHFVLTKNQTNNG